MKIFPILLMSSCAVVLSMFGTSCSEFDPTPTPPTERAPSYLAVETYSGRILHTGNPNERRPIGMLANIATALVVLDWVDARNVNMDREITVPAEACKWPDEPAAPATRRHHFPARCPALHHYVG